MSVDLRTAAELVEKAMKYHESLTGVNRVNFDALLHMPIEKLIELATKAEGPSRQFLEYAVMLSGFYGARRERDSD